MVTWSESLALDTDLLRVDFLVSSTAQKRVIQGDHNNDNNNDYQNDNNNDSQADPDDGACVASEMCIFLWPESSFFGQAYPVLEKLLLDYHEVPLAEGEEEAVEDIGSQI